jgi:subtilisin family serine protease
MMNFAFCLLLLLVGLSKATPDRETNLTNSTPGNITSADHVKFMIECAPVWYLERFEVSFVLKLTFGNQGVHPNDLASELSANTQVRILRTIDLEIFSGVKVEADAESVDTLVSLSRANRAWPVRYYYPLDTGSVATFSSDAQAPKYDIHQFTGVSKAHEAGIFGKDVKVAVIDSGVLYSHPAVRLRFSDHRLPS